MENIKVKFTEDIAKKIFANKNNAISFLIKLHNIKPVDGLKYRTMRNGTEVVSNTTSEVWELLVKNWNYDNCKDIVRELFTHTEKYKNGLEANLAMDILISEWQNLKLGKVGWPFSQGGFDSFVQGINSESIDRLEKDDKVKVAAVKYRRIKEINTVRNDFIETLIFNKNENIIPTLNHRKGLDFFVDGIAYDQKVAKSPTEEFVRKYGENWKKFAIENPTVVAEFLYRYQDEIRFGADPRLYVVYLDEDISIDRMRELINSSNLVTPLEVAFTYTHRNTDPSNYKTNCFVILLYNK